MKVYIVQSGIFKPWTNPYTRTLINGINSQFDDVHWGEGLDLLWTDEVFEYDIVHFMWPEELSKKHSEEQIRKRILLLKRHGLKIVSTCHNLNQHYSNSNKSKVIYDIVYCNSDLIFHLGNYSLSLFKEKYGNANNVLLPHQILDQFYKKLPTKEEAKRKLHLKPNTKYILCFGQFRNKEEQKLVIMAAEKIHSEEVEFLAPRFSSIPKGKNIFKKIRPFADLIFFKMRYPYIKMSGLMVSQNDIPYYFTACDIVMIQRVHILNSGNLPMAMFMGNVVCGPSCGNVGEILLETNNPTFDPKDSSSVANALQQSLILASEGKGVQNRKYALEQWNTNLISAMMYNSYVNIINK